MGLRKNDSDRPGFVANLLIVLNYSVAIKNEHLSGHDNSRKLNKGNGLTTVLKITE